MENLKGELEIINNKLQGKDLITIGIYTALYIVAIFVASVANVTPLTFMFYPAISSLLGAVFFIMLATKVQKFGAVIIWGVIVGLLFLVLGMALTLPFFVVAAIIAQIIISKSGGGVCYHRAVPMADKMAKVYHVVLVGYDSIEP